MNDSESNNPTTLLESAIFEIGGDDQLEKLRKEFAAIDEADREEIKARFYEQWSTFLKDCHIKIGTLLKSDSVSFLLGAGVSKDAGGVLLGTIPKEIEGVLLEEGTFSDGVRRWLKVFYVALCRIGTDGLDIPCEQAQILARRDDFENAEPIKINYEALLSLLYRWRSALPKKGGHLKLDGVTPVDVNAKVLDECIRCTKQALAGRCVLPSEDSKPRSLNTHKTFLKKVLTRPLNLKRVNLFTLNYDTLVEQAADAEGVVVIDGFVGTILRVFRPESYDHDLYFPAETTEGRVHRLDRVIHLYKLHGSINWFASEPDWNNPYGVSVNNDLADHTETLLIYPSPTKYGDILGIPYSELFRRFAASIVRPQSTLFVLGYGFGDEHVNAIICQALAIPSFTLVVVGPSVPGPNPASDQFVARLRAQKDRRVWVISGKTLGMFASFVKDVLPDLRDEEILGKVMGTYRALRAESNSLPSGGPIDGE